MGEHHRDVSDIYRDRDPYARGVVAVENHKQYTTGDGAHSLENVLDYNKLPLFP